MGDEYAIITNSVKPTRVHIFDILRDSNVGK